VKLHAAPAAVGALALALVAVRSVRFVRSGLTTLAVAAVLALPTFASNAVTSGCPLFPAPPCLDVAWRLPAGEAERLRTAIRDFGRGTLNAPEAQRSGQGWVGGAWLWPRERTSSAVAVVVGAVAIAVAATALARLLPQSGRALAVVGGVLAVGLLSRRLGGVVLVASACLAALSAWKARLPGGRALSLVALAGSGMVIVLAPLVRFGAGYVAVAIGVVGVSGLNAPKWQRIQLLTLVRRRRTGLRGARGLASSRR